ncbi:hypothetical protein [Lactobacillus sp. Sy-1]|uniref:hypothetical protein n=1 Tax=Lactobacillus sp. Sy-1 TaxID=2109645 RepID=UPI001C5A91D8|nr:hypothetical protein [Lactobacillus sp. Sy-1]MBW1606262.1 hypothetical protein [Lactobacillus sp. Sy-1]
MKQKIKKFLLNTIIYILIIGGFILGPLIVLHFIFPRETSPDIWLTFIGSYLGSIVAVIGTVIITRMQIKTERLDSLNNSLFIEHYQMLNSLLNDLYHIKNVSLDYGRRVKVINRYFDQNHQFTGIKDYTQNFIDSFDANQFASFYSFSRNRLMSLDINEKEIDQVDQVINNLFDSNRKLVVAYREINKLFSNGKDKKTLIDDFNTKFSTNLNAEILALRETKKLLNQLDQSIQNILRSNHDSIISK